MADNYLQASPNSPYHISVGAVVINKDNLVACHYFQEILGLNDLRILMRESLERHELLETAVARGLMEEFGTKATLITYLGSIVATFQKHGYEIEKTTLYFLMQESESHPFWRKRDDPEFSSEIEWHTFDHLVGLMREQHARLERADLDESSILIRAQDYLEKQ